MQQEPQSFANGEAEDPAPAEPVQIRLIINDVSERESRQRAQRLRRTGAPTPTPLDPHTRIILFLRAVSGRASIALANFYLILGAGTVDRRAEPRPEYDEIVKASSIGYAARTTLSMCCRQIFDHERGELSANLLANANPETIARCAAYWSERDNTEGDAHGALVFLQALFEKCARHPNRLIGDSCSLLEHRIAVVVNHANSESAHITVDPFEVDIFDLAHVAAALGVIGAVIANFDDGSAQTRFVNVDEAAYRVARTMFPLLNVPRLFERFELPMQLQPYWKFPIEIALDHVLNQLPRSIGWWSSQSSRDGSH